MFQNNIFGETVVRPYHTMQREALIDNKLKTPSTAQSEVSEKSDYERAVRGVE